MADNHTTLTREETIGAYREYLFANGELPADLKTLMDFGGWDYREFRKVFRRLSDLETAIIAGYFQRVNDLVSEDENFLDFTLRDKHLTFLYTLVEFLNQDEILAADLLLGKKLAPFFWKELFDIMKQMELPWLKKIQWQFSLLKNVGKSAYQVILIKHSLAVMMFWANDQSAEKEDTEALIEKSADLLFRLTDISTATSAFDLGKFLFTRSAVLKNILK